MSIYVFALAVAIFGSFAIWYLRTQTTTGLNVPALWAGSNGGERWALRLEGGVLAAILLLLAMRDAPAERVLPVFWVLFPAAVIALGIAGLVAVAQLRRERRPSSVLAGAASAMAILAILVWMFLPRVMAYVQQVWSGGPT